MSYMDRSHLMPQKPPNLKRALERALLLLFGDHSACLEAPLIRPGNSRPQELFSSHIGAPISFIFRFKKSKLIFRFSLLRADNLLIIIYPFTCFGL